MLPTRFINTIIITLALGGLSGCKSVETVPFVEVERYMAFGIKYPPMKPLLIRV